MLPLAAIALFALIVVTAPKPSTTGGKPVSFSQVAPIFQERCISCHSAKPTDDVQKIAPNGVMFDTPDQIKKWPTGFSYVPCKRTPCPGE